MKNNKIFKSIRRKTRVRNKINFSSKKQHKVLVHKSNKHFSGQLVDRESNNVILSVSSMEKSIKKPNASNCNKKIVEHLAHILGERIKNKKIEEIVYDKGQYKYHGLVKLFAENLRQYVKF